MLVPGAIWESTYSLNLEFYGGMKMFRILAWMTTQESYCISSMDANALQTKLGP